MLNVQGLSVTIGAAPILSGVTFALGRGETLGLVGESGSGKSMTALAVMGLLPERARAGGRVMFGETELLTADEAALCALRGRRIGMVFQEPMTALNPLSSIGRQIAEPLRLHLRLSRGEAGARVRHLLDRVGLPAPRFQPGLYPHQLSGGQRQRVMLAIALACGPDLLIADEPTTALDVTIQAQILGLIGDITAERGMGLLLITHDLGVVSRSVQRVMVMYAGRVVEQGATAEVFAARRHPYTRGLFAASPHGRPPGPGARLQAIAGQVPEAGHLPQGCAFAPRCPRVQPDCLPAPPPLVDGVACLHPFEAP
jgi:peptide/nickel transport system ATP-binding protein